VRGGFDGGESMAKKKPQKRWVYSPRKAAPPSVPEGLKAEVKAKADALVEAHLKPVYIKPPPADRRWNYIIDIFTKWHGSFFYFCSTYACPGPDALSPTFESRFARMEYAGSDRFNLAYMRHTEKWWEVAQGLTVNECIEMIRDGGIFQP
jgi:hypothetical protein